MSDVLRPLRPHESAAIEAVDASGHTRVGIALPPGTGAFNVMAHLVARGVADGKTVLVLIREPTDVATISQRLQDSTESHVTAIADRADDLLARDRQPQEPGKPEVFVVKTAVAIGHGLDSLRGRDVGQVVVVDAASVLPARGRGAPIDTYLDSFERVVVISDRPRSSVPQVTFVYELTPREARRVGLIPRTEVEYFTYDDDEEQLRKDVAQAWASARRSDRLPALDISRPRLQELLLRHLEGRLRPEVVRGMTQPEEPIPQPIALSLLDRLEELGPDPQIMALAGLLRREDGYPIVVVAVQSILDETYVSGALADLGHGVVRAEAGLPPAPDTDARQVLVVRVRRFGSAFAPHSIQRDAPVLVILWDALAGMSPLVGNLLDSGEARVRVVALRPQRRRETPP